MMPPFLPELWIRSEYWFGEPDVPTPYFAVVAAFFVVALVGAIVLTSRRRRLLRGDSILIGLATRIGPWAITAAATGVFFVLWRYANGPTLSARFLWLLCALALIGLVIYVGRFMRREYQARLALAKAQQVRERYLPQRAGNRRKRR